RLQGRPVGLNAVGKGIAPEYVVDLLHIIDQPRQHGAERAGVAHSAAGTALGLDECVVEARGNPAPPLVQSAAPGGEMDDHKDLGLLVEWRLEQAVVGK